MDRLEVHNGTAHRVRGAPFNFYCARCKREFWRHRARDVGTRGRETGYFEAQAKRAAASVKLTGKWRRRWQHRHFCVQVEYTHACGHTGWTKHADMVDRLLREQAAKT